MKKQLVKIISGFVFLISVIVFYLANKSLEYADSNLQIKNLPNSEYSAFSSGFYNIKSELKRTGNSGFLLPGNTAAVMLAIDAKHRNNSKDMNLEVATDDRKLLPAMGIGGYNSEIRNESIIYYSYTGHEFEKINQFLLMIAIISFLLFFTSFFYRDNNLQK